MFLSGGTERKLIFGIDDRSRFCLMTAVACRATARSVWCALDIDSQVGPDDDCAITLIQGGIR